jgi:hypothetical protein
MERKMALNGILTEAEAARFVAAVCEIRGEESAPANPVGLSTADVVDTRESAKEYIEKYGHPAATDEIDGLTVYQWRGVQRFKGEPRKDLELAEFGPDRLALIVS